MIEENSRLRGASIYQRKEIRGSRSRAGRRKKRIVSGFKKYTQGRTDPPRFGKIPDGRFQVGPFSAKLDQKVSIISYVERKN